MILISIVIGLVLERYCNVGKFLCRFNWFPAYVCCAKRVLAPCSKISPFLALALIVLVPVMIMALIYYPVCGWLFSLFGFIINTAVLIYCLGPATLYVQWQAYIAAKKGEDTAAAKALHDVFLSDLSSEKTDPAAAGSTQLVKGLLIQSYFNLFAVLFWFAIFGWPGALVYRLVAQSRTATNLDSIAGLTRAALWVQQVLDWLPVRIMALAFMVVGAFSPALGVWFRHILRGFEYNQRIVAETGVAALSLDVKDDEMLAGKAAVLLVERSVIVWVVVVALLTIGRLIG